MCHYIKIKNIMELPLCSLDGKICPYVIRCNSEKKWNKIPEMNNCHIRIGHDNKHGNKVRFEKQGLLYIEIEDKVITLDNPFDFVPTHVNLVKTKKGQYQIKKG